MLDQLTPAEDLDHPPTDEEIHLAIKNLRNTGPGESGICAQVYKCLSGSVDSYNRMKQMILHFWETGEIPAEWEIGILKILPKKGDLTNPGNYRGIMMLEVAYKIATNILKSRLIPIQESLDHVVSGLGEDVRMVSLQLRLPSESAESMAWRPGSCS